MIDNQIQDARESARAPLRFPESPPHRILVVEDEIAIRELNIAALLRSGYAVEAAEDGAAALQELHNDSYDLMITDDSMPRLSGVELLKKLYAARMDLPVIMVTGTSPMEEFTRYPWLQPAAVLLKPYTIEEMLTEVKKVLLDTDTDDDHYGPLLGHEVRANNSSRTAKPAGAPPLRPAHFAPRILVVDEDSDLRRLYVETLARPGYHVDTAADGADGWKSIQEKSYDLLITEHDLPGLTGLDLVRKLRAAHKALPVVMAAGRLPTEALARNPSLRLAAMLEKPFEVEALLDTVNNVLRATASYFQIPQRYDT